MHSISHFAQAQEKRASLTCLASPQNLSQEIPYFYSGRMSRSRQSFTPLALSQHLSGATELCHGCDFVVSGL